MTTTYTDAQVQSIIDRVTRENSADGMDGDSWDRLLVRAALSERQAAMQGQGGELLDAAPSIEAAEAMGAKGGSGVEAERLAFEAWMRGHCWSLCATWDGTGYRSDAEQGGNVCPHAMKTRGLWAAWRDRASLQPPQPVRSVSDEGMKNAARYRWLQAQQSDIWQEFANISMNKTDELIDAAIAQEKQS